jgi:hypothetical protein
MTIPPGITTAWNPPDERLYRREIPAHGRGILLKNVYSAGKYQLRGEESTALLEIRVEILVTTYFLAKIV